MAVRFFFEEILLFKGLKRQEAKKIIRQILTDFSFTPGDINYVFTSDDNLLAMNRQFLNHDYYTDILTFPVYDQQTVHGDVFISIERVTENAAKYKIPADEELMRVMIHGALHLCGMEDNTPARKKKMTALEDQYLGRLK
jgi:rRNA maturation RNase YbeY